MQIVIAVLALKTINKYCLTTTVRTSKQTTQYAVGNINFNSYSKS